MRRVRRWCIPVSAPSNTDDSVKNPYAALHGVSRHFGVANSTPRSSGLVRLASGAFYKAVNFLSMLVEYVFTLTRTAISCTLFCTITGGVK
jgi:hypothetical protein